MSRLTRRHFITAAIAAGALRDATGHYTYAWFGAAAMCTIAAVISATIRRSRSPREAEPAAA